MSMDAEESQAQFEERWRTWHPPPLQAKVNDFAIRCFRDTGDGDYIAARLAMRARLHPQYLWAAEQAIEKYLKCILVLNRVDTKKLRHDLERAFGLVKNTLEIEFSLTEGERRTFDNLVRWNADRYFINSYSVEDHELGHLDLLVWRLRQFCEPLDVERYWDEPSRELLRQNVERIQSRSIREPNSGRLFGGELEKILGQKRNPARAGLVWRNLWFSTSNRQRVPMSSGWRIANSPLYLAHESEEGDVIVEAKRWMQL